MRTVLMSLVLGLAVGCSSSSQFDYQSTLYSPTRGVAFQDDSTVQAGMVGNTCEVDVGSGLIGNDVDVAYDDDMVLDTKDGLVLVGGADGVYVYEPGGLGFDTPVNPERPVAGVIAASFVDTGIVTVSQGVDGLNISWGADQQVSLGGQAPVNVSVNGSTGQVYTAQDSVISVSTPDGSEVLAQGDLVVWDSAAQVLYVADIGGTELRALEADGSERFVTQVTRSIVDLSDLGLRGEAALMTGDSAGGELVVINGTTGEIISQTVTPAAAQSIATSSTGNSLAFQLSGTTHFYRLSSF